jgi:hypothetical protein
MERGLVGVLSICFVLSTLLAVFFFGVEAPERITLIRLNAFERTQEKVIPYSIELLVREPIGELRLEFSYLVRVDEKTHGMLGELIDAEEALESEGESLVSMPKVRDILEMEKRFSPRPEYRFFGDTAHYEDPFREVVYDLAVLDIRDFLKYLPESAGPEAYGAYMVFAIFVHEENVSYYQGASDFYLDRLISMGELTYGVNDDFSIFENPSVVAPRSKDYVHIREAPPHGTITLNDLEAEDAVRVSFSTRRLAGPGVLVTRLWVDGEVQENYYSFAGWPEQEY